MTSRLPSSLYIFNSNVLSCIWEIKETEFYLFIFSVPKFEICFLPVSQKTYSRFRTRVMVLMMVLVLSWADVDQREKN